MSRNLGELKYKIVIREPTWSNSVSLWEVFESLADAEIFLKDIGSTYPENTLVFIVSVFSRDNLPTTRKSFVVNEYGDLVPRRRKWVPDKYIPIEQIKSLSEVEIPEDPRSLVEGYSHLNSWETSRVETMIEGLGLEADTRAYDRYKRGKEVGYFKPEDIKRGEK